MESSLIIAVCSGKGGVGKSTVAYVLSVMLAKKGIKVGLLDADIYGPSLHLFFSKTNLNPPAILGNKMIPVQVSGIQFMSGVFFAPGGAFIRAPKATGLISSFFNQVDWGGSEVIIVDFPPGTGDIPLSLFQEERFDGAFVVTTPHTLSVEDAGKSAMLITKSGIPLWGIIENMSYIEIENKKVNCFGKGGGQELADLIGSDQVAQIPLIDQSQFEDGRIEEKLVPYLQKSIEIICDKLFSKQERPFVCRP